MLREIFITVPEVEGGVSVTKDEEAQKKAADVRARALKGEDFAKLAAEASDSPSKANGGLIGPFSRADMSPQLQALVDKMKQGDITLPIRAAKGYQILKIETLEDGDAAALRFGAEFDRRQGRGARTQTEMRQIPRAPARPGHHRVEERRAEEGLREADCGRPASSGQ